MIQSPCVQPFQPVPQAAKQDLNAVKIEIVGASAGGMQPQAVQACPTGGYNQTMTPIYNYPSAPIYTYPAQQQFPSAAPEQVGAMQQPLPQQPQQINITNPGQLCIPGQQIPAVQYPVQGQPPVQGQQMPTVPNVNPQQPAAPAQVPEPQVTNAPQVEKPEAVQPELDLNGFIAKLTNPDFGQQKACMEEIGKIIKEDEEKGTNRSDLLVDTKIYNALNSIINFDSSKLEGPTQEQLDLRQKILDKKEVTKEQEELANKMAPMEQAELNKNYALFTIAMLDKWYNNAVSRLSNSQQSVQLTDLPEIVNVVNQLKDNPNPMVRSSAIEALSYIQKPEYKKDLMTLFELAKKDQVPEVAQQAEEAINKLNTI